MNRVETGRCAACGLPSRLTLCDQCAPAGQLLEPSSVVRLEALDSAGVADRPKVLLAALRGRRLWGNDSRILRWLMENGGTIGFSRWISEDARFGSSGVRPLALQELERTVQRAPLWMAYGRECGLPTGEAIVSLLARRPRAMYALARRLGSCLYDEHDGKEQAQWLCLFPRLLGWLGVYGMYLGRKRPPHDSWRPSAEELARASRWRRWPLERLEADGVVVCTVCGEPLPGNGACLFCETDPEDEAPTVLPIDDLLTDRGLCQRCGIDITTSAIPSRCPGCHTNLLS